jgi:Replication-relaxation
MPKKKLNENLILRERDHIILKLIYEFRFLSGELLWYLIKTDNQSNSISYSIGLDGKRRPSKYGFGSQALNKRLKQLFDAGYVERHYITDLPIGRGHGLPRAIYGLGRNSPRILLELDAIPVNETRKIIEGNNVKSPFLRHALEVANFRVIMKLACDNSQGKANLLFWEQGNALKDHVYGYNGNGTKERFTIHADAFFGIRIGNKTKHFFLEIDRGTEPIVSNSNRSNIRKKLRGYQYYYKSKKIRKKYDLDVNGFQVLIVTPGEIKEDNNLSGRIANIYNEITVNNNIYPTKSLFLLTTPLKLSLSDPKTVFLSIWVSIKIIKYLLSLLE